MKTLSFRLSDELIEKLETVRKLLSDRSTGYGFPGEYTISEAMRWLIGVSDEVIEAHDLRPDPERDARLAELEKELLDRRK